MDSGVHFQPGGTQSGAKALVHACDTYLQGMDIKEYVKDHKELAEAIDFYLNR